MAVITHILKNETPKDIILALRTIMKSSINIVTQISRKILIKVLNSFKLYQYEKIQILTKGKCYINGTFANCKNSKDFSEEDLKLLGLFSFLFHRNS